MLEGMLTVPLVENKLFDEPEPRRVFDVERMAYLISTYESAMFFRKHMRLAKNLVTPHALLEFALEQRTIEGLSLEFGVATGATLNIICSKSEGIVYGFDSFEGLPEDWTHFQKTGRFSSNGKPPGNLQCNAQLVIGYFDETLPKFVEEQSGTVSFAHIDCDLYSSTKEILRHLAPRFLPGTILVFDEYFNYPSWQHHEHKAFSEYLENTHLDAEYIGFASSGQSVAVRLVNKE